MNLTTLKKSFGGKLVATESTKNLICETILKLPEEMVIYLTKHCWFLSSTPDCWAYLFNGSDIPDKHLIFLSDELLKQPKPQIQYTILHEVGHLILKHQNSMGFKQSKKEIKQQEQAADHFAYKYL